MIDINVNDYVRVRLNDLGRKHHREDFLRWTAQLPKKPEYRAPQEDADGWSKWQLWSLMELFGPIISLGAQMPFDSCIQVGKPNPASPTPADRLGIEPFNYTERS